MPAAVNGTLPHPFDPLTSAEIEQAIVAVQKAHGELFYNVVSLHEPRKAEMTAWLADPAAAPRPARIADVVVIAKGGKVYEGFVDLVEDKITQWDLLDGVQPIITMEELVVVEHICRKDPKVIEQCEISGIPKEEMHKVYCDPWTIGYDERHGNVVRLQQALMYYRPDVDTCQYQYPLDFCPIYDVDKQEIVDIDIPKIRRPISKTKPVDYHPAAIEKNGGYRKDIKPINITQPEGVSFKIEGRELEWQNWKFHIGFNYREGIVLNNITYNDKGNVRPIFYRLSLAEMVVPYGNPEHPHQRKHAFDLGEYGAGYMTNALTLGCDCKGSIHYLDAEFPTRAGGVRTIKNAICIHEEDSGILFKHSDFRDDSIIVTRARKLIVQQIFTAANYEYAIQWIFHQDGTIQPEIKLTGILNTYAMNEGEDTNGWGTQVFPGVNAHNHQHLFCLRVDPNIDGPRNTVFQVDTVASDAPVGSRENFYGNAFGARRTKLDTTGNSKTDYNGATSRTWEIANTSKLHPYSGKPASYKLVSREVPGLLPKEGSLVLKRAAFARHAVHVTKYRDDQLWPAGQHVPQTSGEPSRGIPEWIGDGTESIEDEDVVLWHTFGVTHIPAPEDFPVMPVEPITLLLRPRNFFRNNPVLDVPPSYASTPSQVAAGKGALDAADKENNRSWNATGTVAVPPLDNGDEDWFVSTTLTDIRSTNVYFDGWPTAQDLAVFLSVPQSFVGTETGNATRVCGYTMPGQNATSVGDASSEDSCSGVLSEERIEEALKTPMTPSDGSCPELDLGDKCDVSTGFRTSNPVQLNPSVCVLDNLPHTDVPNGYRSFAGFPGWRIMPPDEEENEFDVYDLRVQQTVPMLFTVQSGSQEKVYLVCLAPNKVVDGSREPQAEFPPSDAGVVWRGSGLAFAVTFMAAAMQL
ncbi:hypothetical protein BN1723_015403, partial [Verticillium longisporum]